jgi:hypothetical protein
MGAGSGSHDTLSVVGSMAMYMHASISSAQSNGISFRGMGMSGAMGLMPGLGLTRTGAAGV